MTQASLGHPTLSTELPLQVASDPQRFAANARATGRLQVLVSVANNAAVESLEVVIHRAIEEAVAEAGAAVTQLELEGDRDERLVGQLYRARLLGSAGFALELDGLEHLARQAACLDPEDSATLLWWVGATERHPVQLLVAEPARRTRVYPEPVALAELLPESAGAGAIIEYEPLTLDLGSSASELAQYDEEDEDALPSSPSMAPPPVDAFADDSDSYALATAPSDTEVASFDAEPDLPEEVFGQEVGAPSLEAGPDDAELEAYARELDTTRGPKSFEVIERLFTTRYVPLRQALARGHESADIETIVNSWSSSFEESYVQAYPSLGHRHRPSMILDVPDMAERLARLHGARRTQLLLVDGLRYDLGERVNEMLGEALNDSGACAEKLVLWSGLPCTTATQLELFGRGSVALTDFRGELQNARLVDPSPTGRTPQKARIGRRELYKLDLVEQLLAEPGANEDERIEGMAEEVASAIGEFAQSLPPGTLLLFFGDHGFSFDREPGTTSAGRQGGARPEQVITPAYAWMLGSVH